MKTAWTSLFAGAALALILAGCNGKEAAAPPAPSTMTAEAVGHNCQMYVLDHPGPKAQVHLKGTDAPIWFAEVVDAVAYLRGAEHEADVTAVYVSDMGKARSWEEPGIDNWLKADAALYVIDSDRRGGMHTPDAIPFSDRSAAEAFMRAEGGRIVAFGDIPDNYLKQQAEIGMHAMPAAHGG